LGKTYLALLSDYEIMIEDQVGDLRLRHQGDSFLMAVFIRHGFKGATLK
jgi:hypothetical protein